jgi:hypothetical protein
MALATSGTMSIGGTTANRSINLELGESATATSSLGDADFRGLAEVASGAISMSNFHGKSDVIILQSLTVQNGTYSTIQGAYPAIATDAFWGILTPHYVHGPTFTPGWANDNFGIRAFFWELIPSNGYTYLQFTIGPGSWQPNSGFTAINITDSGGTTRSYQRSAAAYTTYNGYVHWRWTQTLAPTNPMGAAGSISTITIT